MTEGIRNKDSEAPLKIMSGGYEGRPATRTRVEIEELSAIINEQHADGLELKVLGELMEGRGVYEKAERFLHPGTFYNDVHRAIFQTIKKIYGAGGDASLVNVTPQFMSDYPQYADNMPVIAEAETSYTTTAYIETDARQLAEMAAQRSIVKALYPLIHTLQDRTADKLEAYLDFMGKYHDILMQNGLVPEAAAADDACRYVDEGSFSQDLVRYAHSCADAFHISLDVVYTTMFAAVSAAIGSQLALWYKGVYKNYPTLSYCIVAPSSFGKTPPADEILRPLERINKRLMDETKRLKEEVKAENRGKAQLPMPKELQLILKDFTPEARNQALAHNPHGLLLHCDELVMFLKNANRYCNSGEMQQLLNIMDNSSVIINRKSEGATYIESPCMAIYGGIQPDVLKEHFGNRELIASGFNTRWLFCYPDIPDDDPEEDDLTMDDETRNMWDDFICSIYELYPAWSGKGKGGSLELSNTAKNEYKQYKTESRRKQREAEKAMDGYTASIYGKMQIHVLRLAMIIHVMGVNFPKTRIDQAPDDMACRTITLAEMRSAISWANYYEVCAKKVRDLVSDQPKGTAAGHKYGKGEVLRILCDTFGKENINQSMLAKSIGMKQSQVNREFNPK